MGGFAVLDEDLKREIMCWFDFIFSVAVVSPGDNIYSAFIDFEFSSSRPEELFPFGGVVRHFPGDFVESGVGGK